MNIRNRITELEREFGSGPFKEYVDFIADDKNPKSEAEIREVAEDIVLNDKDVFIIQVVSPGFTDDGSKETKRLEDMIEQVKLEQRKD